MALAVSKKKLKASLILFIIALILLVAGVLLMVFGEEIGLGTTGNIVFGLAMVIFIILMMVSLLLNWLYRKNSIVAGAASTALYVFQFIFLAPMVIFFVVFLVYMLMHGVGVQGSENLKKIKIKDENGNEYILTQLYEGSNEYKDQNGDLWETYDGVITFERVIKKVKTDDGKEYNLKPTHDGIVTKYYEDENGEEWESKDGGATFDKK